MESDFHKQYADDSTNPRATKQRKATTRDGHEKTNKANKLECRAARIEVLSLRKGGSPNAKRSSKDDRT